MSFSYNGNSIDPSAPQPAGLAVTNLAIAGKETSRNFFCIQSDEPLSRPQKAQLQEHQVQFQEYLGGNAWLCKYEPEDLKVLRDLPFVSSVTAVNPHYKISPALQSSDVSDTSGTQTIDVMIHDLADQSAKQLTDRISNITGISTEDMTVRHSDSVVRLQVNDEQLYEIANIDDVGSIDKVQKLQLCNNLARGILNSDFKLNDTVFQGKGQTITVADTGFDSGSIPNVHPAFKNRVVALVPIGRAKETDDVDGHGTHVCGSALGDGESDTMGGVIQGTAPAANLVVQALLTDPLPQGKGKVARELFGRSGKSLGSILADAYNKHNSRIHTNSWGPRWDTDTMAQAPYGMGSKQLDDFVWNHQDLVVCFAAGNDGERETATPGAGQVGGQSSAKNCITVGSCDNQRPSNSEEFKAYAENGAHKGNPNHVSVFSSRGPTAEGRIKPDVIAPGAMILSTRSRKSAQATSYGLCKDGDWMFATGTSMATPLVAGCVAALREHLIKQGIQQPSATLIKALLINGAVDLGRPLEEQGFGRVDLSNSIFDHISALDKGFFEDKIYDQPHRDIVKKELILRHPSVEKGSPVTFKATLVYMDQQGFNLQNNINLVVHCNKQKRHGNKGDEQDQYDTINNVEQVVWNNLAIGDTVEVEVSYRVAMLADAVPFAVAWSVNAPLPEKK
ncbi:hypothetical protein FDECE_8282 [Fusarium decemcellulare]|nr:hypothetical protein FDECE_8282 [Fusarium decemcellulare]